MSTESNITGRTLERLKLGELSEAETADVMARLEAAGETHRLDRLIEADEEFLERHPAGPAASQIRERARRRARASHGQAKEVSKWRLVKVWGAAALLLVIVTGGLYMATQPKDGNRTRPVIAETESSDPVPDDEVVPAEVRPSAPSMPVEEPAEWKGLLNWVLENRTGGLIAIACTPGQELRFDARGVRRVSIDQNRLVSVKPTNDGEELIATCHETGLANMNIFEADDTTTNVIVRIAEPYFDRPRSSISPGEQLDFDLSTCGELKDMALQIVAEQGFPAMVIVGGGTREQQACVEKAARAFRDDRPRSDADPGHMLIERTW